MLTRDELLKNVEARFLLDTQPTAGNTAGNKALGTSPPFDLDAALKAMDPELWSFLTSNDSPQLDLTGGVDRMDGSCTSVAFRAQDIESLLDQASSILDRALADRITWSALMERWALLRVDTLQSAALVSISDDEEKNSRFDFEADLAAGQKDARDRKETALGKQNDKLVQIGKKLDIADPSGLAAAEVNRRGAIAFVRDMPDPNFLAQPVTTTVPPTALNANKISDRTQPGTPGLGNLNYTLESQQATAELDRLLGSNAVEQSALAVQTEDLSAQKKGLETQSTWREANRNFLRQRAFIAKQALLVKLSMEQQGDVLDLRGQALSIKTRYIQAVSDAHARLMAVKKGLDAYYGYPFPDKRPDDLPDFAPENTKSHDDIVAWSRRVGHWLTAFRLRTSSYILPISLTSLTGNNSIDGKEHTFSLKDLFDPFQRHIRVYGIAAWAINDRDAFWQVDLTPPTEATVVFESSTSPVTVSQDPTLCRISRVMSRTRLAVPESGAVTSVFKGSPIGSWKVTVKPAPHQQTVPTSFPDDIEIDLYLNYLFVPTP